MPQEPKKRHSRARQGKRRASISLLPRDTKHKLTHFYQMLEKEKAEMQAQTAKKPEKKSSEQEEE